MADIFAGRVAIISGAGDAVGRAVALRMAEEGARLILADADEKLARETAELAVAAGGEAEAVGWNCDPASRLDVANLLAFATEREERLDALVMSSLDGAPGGVLDIEPAALERALSRNVLGAFQLGRAAARRMIETFDPERDDEAGSIVNFSSVMSRLTAPDSLPVSVSGAALEQLTRAMATALAGDKVRVNAVSTGAVSTRALREAIKLDKEIRGAIIEATPLNRIGEAGEAAEAALFLASRRASFVTGSVLTVDGGRSNLDPLLARRGGPSRHKG